VKLSGRLVKDTRILKEASAASPETASFRDALEECLIEVCRELDIQVPVWLKKNTIDISRYRKTSFNKDQFVEKINFDRFDINIFM